MRSHSSLMAQKNGKNIRNFDRKNNEDYKGRFQGLHIRKFSKIKART